MKIAWVIISFVLSVSLILMAFITFPMLSTAVIIFLGLMSVVDTIGDFIKNCMGIEDGEI